VDRRDLQLNRFKWRKVKREKRGAIKEEGVGENPGTGRRETDLRKGDLCTMLYIL